MAPRVLIIDDSAGDRRLLALELSARVGGLDFGEAGTEAELTAALAQGPWQLVLLDYRLGWTYGTLLVPRLRAALPRAQIVLVTGDDSPASSSAAIEAGVDAFTYKRDTGALVFAVRRLLDAQRREQEREALDAQLRLQAQLLDAAMESVIAVAPTGEILSWNHAAEALYGWRREEVLGRRLFDVIALLEPEDRKAEVMAAIRAGRSFAEDFQLGRKDGSVFTAHSRVQALRAPNGEITAVVGLSREVTEERRRERAIREQNALLVAAVEEVKRSHAQVRASEARLNSVLEAMPIGVLVTDGERYLMANTAGAHLLAGQTAEAIRGRRITEIIPEEMAPAALARIRRTLETGKPEPVRDYEVERDGAKVIFESRSIPFDTAEGRCVMALLRDVTEHRELQLRLMVADRMASVGTLAAGVAHELNNPLAFVTANLAYAAEELCAQGTLDADGRAEVVRALEEAGQGATRMRDIIRELKAFSRAEGEQPEAVDVQRAVHSALQMTHNELRHRATLIRRLEPVPAVLGNPARLSQVVLNLLVNAAHACAEDRAEQNTVTVGTRARDDGRVEITVRDTGCGISASNLPRIFDPFFTTKPIGVGTGLGLSICHNTIRSMGGTIEVESREGAGTTFRVILPPHAEASTPVSKPVRPPNRTGARILVIDDEPLILSVFRRVLGGVHLVVTVPRAEEALALLEAGERFDLVFCDVMMPQLGGGEFHAQLQQRAPKDAEAVVFMTGGAFTAEARAFLDTVSNPLLEKPFDADRLRAFVSEQLQASAPPPYRA